MTTLFLAYPMKLASIVSHVLPLSLAVAACLTVGYLKSHGEWDALSQCGLSPIRVASALFVIPLLATLLAVPLNTVIAPLALSSYEIKLGIAADSQTTKESWQKRGEWMTSRSQESDDDLEIAVKRDGKGEVLVWIAKRSGKIQYAWYHTRGWLKGEVVQETIPDEKGGATELRVGLNGLIGASLTSSALKNKARALESRGLDSKVVLAQIALRRALVWACLLVPVISLLLSITARTSRTIGLVPLAIGVSALYWFVLAVFWNGAVFGAWPAQLISQGVVALFVLLTAISTLRLVLRH